jgi:hypothetical protein
MSYLLSVLFNKSGKKRKVSDIEFLAIKEFEGKLVNLNSTSNETTTGVKLTRTPASGKTFYLAYVQVTPIANPQSGTSTDFECVVAIKFNGTIVDTISYTASFEIAAGEGPGYGVSGASLKSNQVGISMDGDAIKKVEVEITTLQGTGLECRLSLLGWEENTADSPQIPSI